MSVSRETAYSDYIALLLRWGAALNLTSARQRSESALRSLIADCLCVVAELPGCLDRLIDLGSGQGFPAIPIAIETGVRIELIESDRRKAAFLTTALAALGLEGAVYAVRIATLPVPPANCVTARALAPARDLIHMAKPYLAPGGTALFLKGPAASTELAGLAHDPSLKVELLSTDRPPSTLVKVKALG